MLFYFSDNAMSTSFVTGADLFEADPDTSMTLTFLNGPQAISTPHGNCERVSQRNSNSNLTFNVFQAAEIGICPEQKSIQNIETNQEVLNNFDEKTCVLFDNIKNNNFKSTEILTENNTTFNVFKSIENPLNQLQSAHSSTLAECNKLTTDIHNNNTFNLQEDTFLIMNKILGNQNDIEKTAIIDKSVENTNNIVNIIYYLK